MILQDPAAAPAGPAGNAPAGADFDQVAATLAARVRATELADRHRAGRRQGHGLMLMLRIVLDACLVNAAFLLAYWTRYDVALLRDVSPENYHSLAELGVSQALFTVLTLVVFHSRGVYAQPRGAGWLDQVGRVANAALLSVCLLLLTSLLFSPTVPSRLLFVELWVTTVGVVGLERYLVKRARRILWSRGINEHRVIVVGATTAGQRVMKHILDRPEMGYRLLGYVDDRAQERRWTVPFAGRPRPGRLGRVADLTRIVGEGGVDELIIALGSTRRHNLGELLAHCSANRVAYRLVPDLMEVRFDHTEIESLGGLPLIGVKEPALRGGRLVLKRVMDLVLATVALVLLAPLMLTIAFLIRVERPQGPILFRQKRAGRGGRVFTCYKFRSMRPDAEALKAQLLAQNEASGPIFKMKNDPRITRTGKWLRRTSLDELPQLFNILRGEMSWVGPRPPIPSEVLQYSDWHLPRLEVTPGLTGLWQVSGRSRLTFDEMVTLDLYYAENWSVLLDCKLLLQTLPAVLFGHGAY